MLKKMRADRQIHSEQAVRPRCAERDRACRSAGRRELPDRYGRRIAASYDLLSWLYSGRQIARLKLEQALMLEPGSRVLFAGAGTGEELAAAAAVGAEPTAVDVSEAMLERAQRRLGPAGRSIAFLCQDIFAHEPTRPYDCIVANFFLNVFSAAGLPSALECLSRLLRPGGALLVGDFAPPSENPLVATFQRAYYLPPLALFWALTRNPWHPLYDYRPYAQRLGLRLTDHRYYRIFGLGPRWLSTMRFEKAAHGT